MEARRLKVCVYDKECPSPCSLSSWPRLAHGSLRYEREFLSDPTRPPPFIRICGCDMLVIGDGFQPMLRRSPSTPLHPATAYTTFLFHTSPRLPRTQSILIEKGQNLIQVVQEHPRPCSTAGRRLLVWLDQIGASALLIAICSFKSKRR